MRRLAVVPAVVLSLVLLASAAHSQQSSLVTVTVVAEPDNVVASELLGVWYPDKELTQRLSGRADNKAFRAERITFRKSDEAQERIVAHLQSLLNKLTVRSNTKPDEREVMKMLRTVYLAGEVVFHRDGKETAQDFALVTLRGNPCILYYDREGDMESTLVMLARDKVGDNDLLFIGGDFNNQSFAAWRRNEVVEGLVEF